MELDKELTEGKEAVDVIDETQDYQRKKADDPLEIGDRVVHSRLYISICRGEARVRALAADLEVIGLTARSVTTRPWGSTQKYGSQFERRYIMRKPS